VEAIFPVVSARRDVQEGFLEEHLGVPHAIRSLRRTL
jgi:hypothetical protein